LKEAVMATKRAKRFKRRQLACTVGLEISRNEVSAVMVDRHEDGTREVRGRRATWLQQATSLNSEQGRAELTAFLTDLAQKEQLTGGSVSVSLSSEFCVTRVLAGETDRINSELRSIRERSTHYLSLGFGAKAMSQSVRLLDVKNSHAWLTVTNEDTLQNVMDAVSDAGMFPELIEHSIVAICRAVGRMGIDTASPVIIIEPTDRGADLGISYRGQLLFDYRPGGTDCRQNIAEIVEHHLERIQRYCNRFFRFASGQINRVYLVGAPADVEQVKAQFAKSTRLSAETIDPSAVCPDWKYAEDVVMNAHYVAPLGTALVEAEQLRLKPDARGFPDLMDVFRSGHKEPLLPLVKRHLWPVAAAALLGMLVYGGAMLRGAQANSLLGTVTQIENDSSRANNLKLELEAINGKVKIMRQLDQEASYPAHELLSQIVMVKPATVYLNTLQIAEDGTITLQGTGETQPVVYSFEAALKKLPLLKSASVEKTTQARLETAENATGFTLKARFADSSAQTERTKNNG